MRYAVALLLCMLVPAGLLHADEGAGYGPMPEALAKVEVDGGDRRLADDALAMLRRRTDTGYARALLVMLGDAGLQAAARRLTAGDVKAPEKTDLLHVASVARHPAADALLAAALEEPSPRLRAVAAHGLGLGRTDEAVDALASVVNDPLPVVRIAAMRSLFAHPSPAARTLRMNQPADTRVDLLARRLAWHARAGDASPALLNMAKAAYLDGKDAALRMEAADYLTRPELGAPVSLLEIVMREMGGGPITAWVVRLARGADQKPYDNVRMRVIAIRACFTLLAHPDATPAQREQWLRWAVGWVAHPVSMNPYSRDAIPENELRRRLPDFGNAIVEPVVALLKRHAFNDPRKGMILLRELGPDVALPVAHAFLEPGASRPAYASRADAQRRRYLRGAAAQVLQELGRVGDETLARALLLGDEPLSLKVEIVQALAGDDGAWAVPLLVKLMQDDALELRTDAILALEKRKEPEARDALIADLFDRTERVHDRLRALVRRGDDAALAVIDRALKDERLVMRKAALEQFRRDRQPTLCRRGADLVRAYTPELANRRETQAFLYALLNVAPEEAVAFVDTQWDALPNDDARRVSLRMLRETTGKAAREAAMDLALRRVPLKGADRPLALAAAAVFHGPSFGYDWRYRPDDIGAYFRAWLDHEDVHLQREALTAWAHSKAPPAVARLHELLTRAREGRALPERDTTHVGEQAFAERALTALAKQAWDDVEPIFVDVALDRTGDIDLALVAAYRLIGRVSDETRVRLSTWLGFDEDGGAGAPGRNAHRYLQLFLSAAVGTGADEATAMRLQRTLARELWSFFDEAWMKRLLTEGPGVLVGAFRGKGKDVEITRAYAFYTRVSALARAVSSTRHEQSILDTLELLLDPRLAVFARECVRREARFLREAGASAAAIVPSELNHLVHGDSGNTHWGMPLAVYEILREAKVVDDAKLATAFERVFAAARADGRLARFPALYFLRMLESQLEPHTGRKPATADVIWRYAALYGEGDRPTAYWFRRKQATQLAEARRFAEAADAQAHVVRTLIRGNHTAHVPGFYSREHALLLALQGAAAEAEDPARAAALFKRAHALGPDHPDALNTVAWYRALAKSGLEHAEVEALRATRLEARVDNRPGVNAADTLAYVLLLRGKPLEGLRVLAPRMNSRGASDNGLLHYHMAQLHTALGRLRSGREALVEALTWDRALIVDVPDDPHLAPLLEKVTLDEIKARAKQRRFEVELP